MTKREGIPVSSPRAWLTLGIAIAAGCAGVSRSLVTPEVELVNLAVLGASTETQRFALTFLVSNTNAEALRVQEIRYSVRLAGQGYLNGRSSVPVTLAPTGRQTVRVELETDGVASLSTLLAFVQGPDNALAYELTGDLVLGTRPERLLPFTYNGEVPLNMTSRN
ncbi:MAG TPA: LEA type 2 family protein [Gammaproteobacteria bacterium]